MDGETEVAARLCLPEFGKADPIASDHGKAWLEACVKTRGTNESIQDMLLTILGHATTRGDMCNFAADRGNIRESQAFQIVRARLVSTLAVLAAERYPQHRQSDARSYRKTAAADSKLWNQLLSKGVIVDLLLH